MPPQLPQITYLIYATGHQYLTKYFRVLDNLYDFCVNKNKTNHPKSSNSHPCQYDNFKLCNQPSECECIGVLRHMQRYFTYICDGTDVQADKVRMSLWKIPRDTREKGRDLTQSCDKSPYTHRKIQKAT